VVCDVYEYAFYVDYQNKRADFVKKFVAFIDWDEDNPDRGQEPLDDARREE
jgi:superoxide dismutase